MWSQNFCVKDKPHTTCSWNMNPLHRICFHCMLQHVLCDPLKIPIRVVNMNCACISIYTYAWPAYLVHTETVNKWHLYVKNDTGHMDFKFHMQHLPVVDIRGLVNVVHRKCGLLYRYIYPYVAKVRNRGEGKRCDNLACARIFFNEMAFLLRWFAFGKTCIICFSTWFELPCKESSGMEFG